ncbi:MAG: TetR/AcrR family transcriptional regulator [Spirochaetaceae bacterium]|nr:TetR/AcrR family transcriptional regulator [Myxococcales bacterium]MCB9723773.1 TetR/AcrR family transcriptional regulator [Spirochaetaceae bacterium]HPG27383.1 TetR/AcrR family transcriptional regulator [Myxococcota bacterium]
MSHAPQLRESACTPRSDGADPVARSLMTASPGGVDPSDSDGEPLVDQGGRPLGPRAIQTRARILEATVALLDEKPMRDLRVIDIARRIGSSPATFYQYFKDVEDVVLYLAREMSEITSELVEVIGGDWTGRAGHERGQRLANLVIDHWDRYAPVLRVRNNASDEGNLAFREVRMEAMMPLVDAFAAAIERAHVAAGPEIEGGNDWPGGRIHPISGATALASVLERLAMYHVSIAELGGSREHLVETIATMLQQMLASRR